MSRSPVRLYFITVTAYIIMSLTVTLLWNKHGISLIQPLNDNKINRANGELHEKQKQQHQSFVANNNATASHVSSVIDVAVGGALTTSTGRRKAATEANMNTNLPFFVYMLPSFCATASATSQYRYHFYFTYDSDDRLLRHLTVVQRFIDLFNMFMRTLCARHTVLPSLHLFPCNYSGKPAWAQNDAMMRAYLDGMVYFYRQV